MLRHIPPYVLGKYGQGQYSGSFEGYVLLLETVDFPIFSNVFISEGKRGAEALSRFLSEVVGPPINMIEQAGGFVCQFSGEAFYAVFPELDAACLKELVESIDQYFINHAPFVTRFGEYPISIKQTIAWGSVNWQIFRNRHQFEFVFYGEPFHELVKLRLNRGSLILSDPVKHLFAEQAGYGGRKLEIDFDLQTSEHFIQPSFRLLNPENDICTAGYCFINLANLESANWENAIALIHDKLSESGGYLHKLYFSETGLTALVLFGLPKATETTSEKMCKFALDLIERLPQVSIGMSWGKAFSGLVGRENRQRYVVLGTTVALAEQSLFRTHPKEIITDSYLKQEMQYHFSFEPTGTLTMAGINLPVKLFKLKSLEKQSNHRQRGSFWGRSGELAWMKERLYEAGQKGENCLIVVKGEAGIGKSKLISELFSSFQEGEYYCYPIFSSPDMHYARDGIRQILRSYFHFNPHMPKEEGLTMFRGQWAELAGSDTELQRLESIIASMLGYTWKNSVWSMLPEKEKGHQLQNAFVVFMELLSQRKPILLHIDDIQWLDRDSLKLLEALSSKGVTPLHIIACIDKQSSEPADGWALPMYQHLTLDLSSLDSEASQGFLEAILQIPSLPEKTVDQLIELTEGNPLYMEQLCMYLKETKSLDESGNIVNNDTLMQITGLRDVIGRRLRLVNGTLLQCLQYAAVIGKVFDARVLKGMFKGDDVLPELKEGSRLGFWHELDEMDYVFLHDEVYNEIYYSLNEPEKKRLHLKAAIEMENAFGKEKDTLHKYAQAIARHYKLADESEKAAQHYLIDGLYLQDSYELERAKLAIQEGIAIHHKFSGAESSHTVFYMEKLGSLYCTSGELSKAEEVFLSTLEIKKKRLGLEHLETAVSLNILGNLYSILGKLQDAESCLYQSAEIRKKLLGDEHHSTVRSVISLAEIYHRRGKYNQAAALYNLCLDPRAMVGGALNLQNAGIVNHLGLLSFDQKNYEIAENYHRKAVESFQKLLGREHPKTLEAITNLAKDHLYLKHHELSESLLIEAIGICERVYGYYNPATASNIHNLGYVYMDTGKLAKTEETFLKALEIRKKSLGIYDITTLGSYNSIAMLYYKMGLLDKTEATMNQSLNIARVILGNDHLDTVKIMFNLATVRIKLEKFAEAEPLYLEALAKYEKEYGLNHPETKDALKHIIKTYQYLKQPEKVAVYQNMLNLAENKKVIENHDAIARNHTAHI